MAKVSRGSLFHGCSGKMGNLVFRTRGNVTTVSKWQGSKKTKPSVRQEKVQGNFGRAAKYAKEAIRDAALVALYTPKAVDGKSVYNVAFADAFHSPVVEAIDATGYRGEVGGTILIKATDDFKVARVSISVFSGEDGLIETGDAVVREDGIWMFTAMERNRDWEDCRVLVMAWDLPGNVGGMEVRL
ncbi:MAG: hypothetical protein H7Y03_02620 [Chitinophagaceae bacterium]|nr:hypothetical protein [Chitinophagaceae bacterium]